MIQKEDWIMYFRFLMAGLSFILGLLSSNVIFYLVSYVVISYDIILNAVHNVIKGMVMDEYFLMMIATFGAFYIGEYPEAVIVMYLFQVGEYLQDKMVDHSRTSIKTLIDMKSSYANIVIGEETKKVDPSTLKIDDCILVKQGEKVPVDGTIIEGEASVDTHMLTGEATPRQYRVGDTIYSGAVTLSGMLKIKVTKIESESMASRILDFIEHASDTKTKTERFITKFSKIYTPIVVVCALLLAIIPPLCGAGNMHLWLYRALIFLVISCPCALVISIPLGYFKGIGTASKNGILLKGSDALDEIIRIKTAVFDKTGTITEGIFAVSRIQASEDVTEEEVLKLAAHAEYFSNHPLARAIVKAYPGKIKEKEIQNMKEVSGKGVEMTYHGSQVLVGNKAWITSHHITVPQTPTASVYVAYDNKYYGSIMVGDRVKEESKEVLHTLKKMGIKKTVLLSGDYQKVVKEIACELDMDAYYAEALPVTKVHIVEEEMKKNPTLFVGDGINDAPVLLAANIGVSMGNFGSDAAISASDVVLMHDTLTSLPTLLTIAQKTRRIIWFNIVFAISVKLLMLVLGVFGITTIWFAVFADVGVSLLTILNTLRI